MKFRTNEVEGVNEGVPHGVADAEPVGGQVELGHQGGLQDGRVDKFDHLVHSDRQPAHQEDADHRRQHSHNLKTITNFKFLCFHASESKNIKLSKLAKNYPGFLQLTLKLQLKLRNTFFRFSKTLISLLFQNLKPIYIL